MPNPVSTEDILTELQALREQLGSAPSLVSVGALAAKHSDWSAHGRWSSSAAQLAGDFVLTSKLSTANQPVAKEQLDKLMADASSESLIRVAESLRKQLGG